MIPSLIPISLYLAKMTAISAFFFIYYRIFLRNSPRHGYNRSFLLGTMTLALLIPLLRLPFPASWTTAIYQADVFIQPNPATPVVIVTAKRGPSAVAWLMAHQLSVYCVIAYAGVACLFLWPLLRSLHQLLRLSRTYASERGPGYRLYRTRETGTPFSFFNHLFWNEAIPLDTAKGQAILWLVMEAAGSAWPSAHSFYSNHLQKRITMILETSRPRGLLRQMAVLPLTILLCCAFAQTPSRHQVAPGKELMHFYLRHLRYPAAAIQEGLEQTESFSLHIGEHNQLLEFKSIGAEQAGAGISTGRITVKARAVARTIGTRSSPLPEDKKDVFVEELRTVSSSISTDTTATYPPGEYAFTIKFRLEPAQ
jgi:hypothetical protein